MNPPALGVVLARAPTSAGAIEERVVFHLRADQLADLQSEARRQAVAQRRRGGDKRGHQINVSQVIRDALVAAGVIEP